MSKYCIGMKNSGPSRIRECRPQWIWGKLDNLTEILEGIENPETMSEEELIGLNFKWNIA